PWARACSLSSRQEMPHRHMTDMAVAPQLSPAAEAKFEADKRFSEFNHQFAGLFVLLVGILTLAEPLLEKYFGGIRYLWSVLFLIHSHAGAMTASQHLSMQKVEHQHLGFAAVGFGIALSKAAVDMGRFNRRLMRNIFALLIVTLGVLLLAYTE